MDFGTIGLLLSLGLVGFFYYKTQKKQKAEQIVPETVQELFDYKEIRDDGLIELRNGTFSKVIAVQPTNIKMKSQTERDSIWLNFRGLLNTLPIHTTLLVQSIYIDMGVYIDESENEMNDVRLTDPLRKLGNEIYNDMRGNTENKTRDYRSYIILRFNPYEYGTESGITTGHGGLDDIVSKVRGETTKISDEEAKELAETMLDEVADIIYHSLGGMKCKGYTLNKLGVLQMLHGTMNRDLASFQEITDIYASGGFSDTKQSLTPFISKGQVAINETTGMPYQVVSFDEHSNDYDEEYSYEGDEQVSV